MAERRAHGVIAGFLVTLADARERLEDSKPTMSGLAKQHFRLELEADDRARAAAGANTVADFNAMFGPQRASLLRLVAARQIIGEEAEALVGYAVDALIEAGLIIRDHLKTLDRAELLRSLAEAQLDVLTRAHERNRGVIVPSEPRSPLLTQADPEPIAPTPQERATDLRDPHPGAEDDG